MTLWKTLRGEFSIAAREPGGIVMCCLNTEYTEFADRKGAQTEQFAEKVPREPIEAFQAIENTMKCLPLHGAHRLKPACGRQVAPREGAKAGGDAGTISADVEGRAD
jgi:hypothetical protein